MQDQQKIEQEHYDDEISLIDLFLVLLRWKKLFIGVFFACLLAGIGYALISYTPSQNYHSTVEIGTYSNNTVEIGTYSNNWETEVLESPKELQSFLQEALLPSVRHKIAQQWEIESWKLPKVEIKIPDSPANLILLKSQISTSAPQDRQKQMEQLHDELIDSVKKRHNDKLNTYQTRLDATLEQKRLAIDLLEEKKSNFLNKRQALFHQQEENLQKFLTKLQPFELDSFNNSSNNNSLAMGKFLHGSISVELQQELRRVQEKQLKVEEQLASLKNEIEQEKQKLRELKSQEGENKPTTALFVARLNNIEGNRQLIIALSAVLGIMLGIFSPFIAELLNNVRIESQRRQV